ncbi:hypothetical protein O3P69_020908 [Scylla paramamosain]|uniref:DDE-1 domain-containing protein n=1 Tax=Scylla paramamosain TaxID=85552 RepID=A0AAW0TNG9_SCYPA
MDQGVIATFKAYYQHCMMKQLITAIDGEGRPTIKQFWAKYDIKKTINNVNESWMKVKEEMVSGCCGQIWEECVTDFKGFANMADVRRDIVHLSHLAGFTEVEKDVEDLLESHDQPLSSKDLMQLEQERAVTEEEEEEPEPQRILDIKTLWEVFSGIDRSLELLKEHDPNSARSGTASPHAADPDIPVAIQASLATPAASPNTPAAIQASPTTPTTNPVSHATSSASPVTSPATSATASPPIPVIAGLSPSAAHSSPSSMVDLFLISDDDDDE